jgi:hypothetical protein
MNKAVEIHPEPISAVQAPVSFASIVTDPARLMQNAKSLADQFTKIVDTQKMYTAISGKKHVHVDGWSMMGVLLGVFPHVVSTERVNSDVNLTNGKREVAYKSTVAIRTLGGQEITRVESICSNAELKRSSNDEYSIFSMSQTRATGKAFRIAFGWIARMAGYDSTPYEEVTKEMYKEEPSPAPIHVMDDLKGEIEKCKTIEEYRKACERVSKYGAQLNADDIKEIRSVATKKKIELDKIKVDTKPVEEKKS